MGFLYDYIKFSGTYNYFNEKFNKLFMIEL